MKSYEEAFQIIKDEISILHLQTEVVRIEESLNRILADDIISDVDLPPFDNSAMDGYALRQVECSDGQWLPISQRIPASGAAFTWRRRVWVGIMAKRVSRPSSKVGKYIRARSPRYCS